MKVIQVNVLNGRITKETEKVTGVIYGGEFYSPTFLALEAIDYYEEGNYEAVGNILDLIQQCVDKDYNNMPGKRLAEILHMGMIMDSKREYQAEMQEFEDRIKRLENWF